MNILLVGALSWNPERVLTLAERGHRLYGLWSRTMAWEQGPYDFTRGVITDLNIEAALDALRAGKIDIVYSLFQLYDETLWAPQPAPGVEDVWGQLRRLLRERDAGAFDVPIVKHWGFDVHNLDLDVVRALDGQLFCNHQKLRYWTAPRKVGGCGLDLGLERQEVAILDSDLPSREFMNDRFAPKLSASDGQIHTVCVGRPMGIDFLNAAREGIHIHVYGNNFDDVAAVIARGLPPTHLPRLPGLIANHLHVHQSIQPADFTLEAIRAAKDRWVEEFSRYDAGWSYVGRPMPWPRLEDMGAIPNKLGTYLLAGLPIIVETLPGYHRYDSVAESGVAVDFPLGDYARLAAALRRRDELAQVEETARRVRHQFSFDATIDPLIDYFQRVIERRRNHRPSTLPDGPPRLIRLFARPFSFRGIFEPQATPGGLKNRAEILIQRTLTNARAQLGRAGVEDFVRWTLKQSRTGSLESRIDDGAFEVSPDRAARVAVIERLPGASRNCDPAWVAPDGAEVRTLMLGGDEKLLMADGRKLDRREYPRCALLPFRCLRSVAGILTDSALSSPQKRSLIASALATRGAPFAALAGAHQAARLLRSEPFDRIDCYSARDFALVPMLSELSGTPYREFLARGTRYFGEFAFELLAVVPYAYWLHCQGRLEVTQSSADTRCLYYFSPRHQELADTRTYLPVSEYPCMLTPGMRYDQRCFPERFDTAQWTPPPYKSIYANQTFRWPKPLCIISNKYTTEPSAASTGGQPTNFIPVPTLMKILGLLHERYQVVYARPRPSDIVGDHQPIGNLGDFEAIQQHFPSVLTIQQIHAQHPELSFNQLQLKLCANCERFISVLGGSSYLASYFGGTNVIFARDGWEVSANAYTNWFHLFSGAKIFQATEWDQLVDLVQSQIVPYPSDLAN